MRICKANLTCVCAMSGALILPPIAIAAEWEKGAGIAIGSYFTDNVCLANSDKQDKWVGSLRPDVSIKGRGSRGNVSLRAAADYNSLRDSDLDCETGRGNNQLGNRESVIPSVQFDSDYELVPEWLVVMADASARRNAINPFAPGAEAGFDDRDNTTITYDYTVGAQLQRRLAHTADLSLRYDYNEQFNNNSSFGDSSEDRAEFGLDTIPGAARLSVGVGGRYSKIRYDQTETQRAFDSELSSAEVRAALQLGSWQLNGLAGEEWNEFTSANPDIEGSFWDAGVLWTPNSRIEVGAGYGERFFGSTPRANVSYRHKRSTVTASYTRTLSVPRNLRVGNSGFIEPEDPFDTGSGEIPDLVGLPTFVGNSPVLDERLEIRYKFVARRSSFSLFGGESRQRRVEDNADATFRNVDASITRTLSSVLSANLDLSWSEREGEGGTIGPEGQLTEIWRTGFGFTRRVGNDTTLNVSYAFVSSESDFGGNDYDENRVTFNVRHAF